MTHIASWKIPELNGALNGKITDKWATFHRYVKLPEGKMRLKIVFYLLELVFRV